MRKKFLRLSLLSFLLAVAAFVLTYFFFHYVTSSGITTVWQAKSGKPFIAEMIGDLCVLFLFSGILSLGAAFVFDDKGK